VRKSRLPRRWTGPRSAAECTERPFLPAVGGAGRIGTSRAIRRVGARLSGRWRASQQSRYGLLDDRLHCIFIHRHLWGERPPQTGSSAVGAAGPGRPSRLRGKQYGTASVGINGRLGSVMSASIQPRRERSPVVITSRSSGSSRKGGRARAARWRRLAAWRSRCAPSGWYQVRRSRRQVNRGGRAAWSRMGRSSRRCRLCCRRR
jgi:hypothetical protein